MCATEKLTVDAITGRTWCEARRKGAIVSRIAGDAGKGAAAGAIGSLLFGEIRRYRSADKSIGEPWPWCLQLQFNRRICIRDWNICILLLLTGWSGP